MTGGVSAPELTVRAYSKEYEDRGEQVRTGSDGRFDLAVAGPGEYRFTIAANRGSYADSLQTVPDRDHVDLAFEVPGGGLSGRVFGADERRVPITIVRSGFADWDSFYRDGYRSMYTEKDGSFAFRLLAPGSYTLRAPDGFQDDSPPPRVPHGRVVLTDLEVGAAEVAGIDVRLPAEGMISGVVVDARGNPVTGAWIGALDERGLSLAGDGWETRTDATGHFQINNVAPGTHTVRARSGENETHSTAFEIEAGKTASTRIEFK